jgi:hypothetical protein
MTTQTKKAPGRPPKAQPAAAPAPTKKKTTFKREEKVQTNKEYEVIKGGGVAFLLPQKGITVYDKEKDTVREIRYCPNEPSIWSDKQSDRAVRQAIIFRDKKLFVSQDKPNLRDFMEMHPGNAANGGSMFKEVNKTKDAAVELEKEFALNDAISKIRDTSIEDLLAVALYYNVDINTSSSDIRFNLLQIAKRKPTEFMRAFESPQVTARATLVQAKDWQLINVKKDGVYWFDSNKLIVSVPVGQEPMDVAVRFCLTEKGASVLSSLEDKLERLG